MCNRLQLSLYYTRVCIKMDVVLGGYVYGRVKSGSC